MTAALIEATGLSKQFEVGGGGFTTYPPQDPALFAADVMLIGDMGTPSAVRDFVEVAA